MQSRKQENNWDAQEVVPFAERSLKSGCVFLGAAPSPLETSTRSNVLFPDGAGPAGIDEQGSVVKPQITGKLPVSTEKSFPTIAALCQSEYLPGLVNAGVHVYFCICQLPSD